MPIFRSLTAWSVKASRLVSLHGQAEETAYRVDHMVAQGVDQAIADRLDDQPGQQALAAAELALAAQLVDGVADQRG